MKARHEWRPGADFAEFAEALGIDTNQIMAASAVGAEKVTVLFTAKADEYGFDYDEPVLGAILVRDADKILRVLGEPAPTQWSWGDVRTVIEEKMDEVERGDDA